MIPAGSGPEPLLRLGISPCLLGEEVRHDGGHRRVPFLADVLGPRVDWVRVCPEVEIGLGVPREPIQLVRAPGGTRLLGVESNQDLTDRMTGYAREKAGTLGDLDGFVLKSRSPSCGLDSTPVRGGALGRGLFAAALLRRHPDLPVVEETDLEEERAREHFLERAQGHRRLRQLLAGDWSPVDLAAFHARHEVQLRAHSDRGWEELSGIVAAAAALPREDAAHRYRKVFARTLAARGRHAGPPSAP